MDRTSSNGLHVMIWVVLVASNILVHARGAATDDHNTTTLNLNTTVTPNHGTTANGTAVVKHRHNLRHERLHGWLLWAGLNFLMPLGTIIVRMTKSEIEKGGSGRRIEMLVKAHNAIQALAVVFSLGGGAISLRYFGHRFHGTHHRLGLSLYLLAWLMPFMGFFRPKRGVAARPIWYALHWLFGTALIILGFIDTYIGLQIYERHSARSQRTLNILLSIQISIMGAVYLFQDRLGYMKRQGVASKPLTKEISLENGQISANLK